MSGPAPDHYDYACQAWIKDGRVARCGHRNPMALCYACAHCGEPHTCGPDCFIPNCPQLVSR